MVNIHKLRELRGVYLEDGRCIILCTSPCYETTIVEGYVVFSEAWKRNTNKMKKNVFEKLMQLEYAILNYILESLHEDSDNTSEI